jgi:hypothetical protein
MSGFFSSIPTDFALIQNAQSLGDEMMSLVTAF